MNAFVFLPKTLPMNDTVARGFFKATVAALGFGDCPDWPDSDRELQRKRYNNGKVTILRTYRDDTGDHAVFTTQRDNGKHAAAMHELAHFRRDLNGAWEVMVHPYFGMPHGLHSAIIASVPLHPMADAA